MDFVDFVENDRIQNLPSYRRKYDYSSRLPALVYLVDHARRHQATDRGDKIFALQGLSQEQAKPELVVDYLSSTEQVFVKFALYEIFEQRDLNILSSAPTSNMDLPFWVPTWTAPLEEGFPMSSSNSML